MKTIILSMIMLVLVGCSGLSEKDRTRLEVIDLVTDIVVEVIIDDKDTGE